MKYADMIRRSYFRREAEGFLELGLCDYALEALQKIDNRIMQEDAGMLYLKGECLRSLNRFQEAWGVLETVATIRPGHVYVLVSLACCQKRAGRVDLASHTIQEALLFEPENSLLHFNASCYYSLLGNKEKTLHHLNIALTLDPMCREQISEDPDFDPVRGEPEFLSLLDYVV